MATIEGLTVEIGVEPSETFCVIAKVLGFVKERTCHNTSDDELGFRCSDCNGYTPLPLSGVWFKHCPDCGAKVVSE